MKRFITFIFSTCVTTISFAQQQLAVPMKLVFADKDSKYYSSFMRPLEKLEDLSGFRNIPAKPEMKAVYSVTAYRDDESKGVFHVYVGLDKESGEKYVIVDSNGNLDFGDDHKYTFALDVYDNLSDYRVDMELGVIVPLSVKIDPEGLYKNTYVKINPYSSYDPHEDKDGLMLDFLATTSYFYRDTVKINGMDVTITATDSKNNIVPDDILSPDARFTFFTDARDNKDYIVGDTLIVADEKLYLRKLENNILYIDDLGHYADSSRVGSYLPALFARDLNDNTLRLLNDDFKDKFVLIDFWGSWCKPCVAALPGLVKLNEEIENRDDVMIVGIAVEYKASDTVKLKEIIKDNGVTWVNYWQEVSRQNSHLSPAGKLRVRSYPSHIIVDKNGKIVFSSVDEIYPMTEKVVDFFINLIIGK